MAQHINTPKHSAYVCNTGLNGAETCTLRKVDHKYLQTTEKWCWGRMENQMARSCEKWWDVAHSQGHQEYPTYSNKANWILRCVIPVVLVQ